MKDWGVSRLERFEGEKHLLKPCPDQNWEQSEWRTAKVHADCHVQIMKKFYSVPYRFVGREVRVRITTKMIDVFDQDLNALAVHIKLVGKETHSTDPRHYPEEKLALTQFSVQVALREAEKIGPETLKVVSILLEGSFPLKYLRRVQGILRLKQSNKVTTNALEHACRLAQTFSKLNDGYIKATAEHFDKTGNRPVIVRSAPKRDPSEIYLHNPIPKREETIHDQ